MCIEHVGVSSLSKLTAETAMRLCGLLTSVLPCSFERGVKSRDPRVETSSVLVGERLCSHGDSARHRTNVGRLKRSQAFPSTVPLI